MKNIVKAIKQSSLWILEEQPLVCKPILRLCHNWTWFAAALGDANRAESSAYRYLFETQQSQHTALFVGCGAPLSNQVCAHWLEPRRL